MSSILPTISVTAEKHLQSESSDDDSNESNDMDYNRNFGLATDVEDFDSQTDADRPRSRRSSANASPKPSPNEGDVTDVEDYNDSDSDDDERSKVYPELQLSLQEFLQQGLREQAIVSGDMQEKIEIKAGNFLQAQNLNGVNDYLTDCEDYNTDSEIEYDYDKSVCVDLDAAVGDQGRVCITDATRPTKGDEDSDEYEDVSVLSDLSEVVSALSDVTGAGLHGISDEDSLEVSGDEEECQMAYSGSSTEAEDNANVPAMDVAFVPAGGTQRRSSTTVGQSSKTIFLEVGAARTEEVHTDIEGLEDSAGEEDSFDNEEESEKPIPRAVILAPGDDGTCVTDTEEMTLDDIASTSTASDPQSVAAHVLPPPHREVIELKEDNFGDTITNVMPMEKDYQFGIYNDFKDDVPTDSEDYSCAEELSRKLSITEDALEASGLIEGEVIVANEIFKPLVNKRIELHTNAETVTDVEEIYVAGTNRRKKLKTRSMSKGKPKYLEVAKGKDDGGTDVEEMDLSECGLPSNVRHNTAEQQQQQMAAAADKVTDVEDITADDISDVSEADVPQISPDNASLREYQDNRANIVVTLETDGGKRCTERSGETKSKSDKIQQTYRYKLLSGGDDAGNQPNTDVEDVQLPSDVEEACDAVKDCVCSALNDDMLNESYTVVHEQSGSGTFDVDAEKLHIKGLTELRDAHTDVEYVESDESAARGGN